MAISEINDKSLAASAVTATKLATSAVDLTSNKVTGILPAANVPAEFKNINPNIFINGNFDVWQRSTSYTENQGAAWFYGSADRWAHHNDGADAGVFARDTVVPNANSRYSMKLTGAANIVGTNLNTRLEYMDTAPLRKANALTVSGWVRASTAGQVINLMMLCPNAIDAFGWPYNSFSLSTSTTISGNGTSGTAQLTLTTANTWYYFTATHNNPNSLTNANGSFSNGFSLQLSIPTLNASSKTVNLSQFKLEPGLVATEFVPKTFAEELALCQRYYEKSYNHNTALGSSTDVGALYGPGPTGNLTTGFLGSSQTYAVNKRAASTIVIYSTSGNSGKCTRDNFGVGNDANSTVLTAHLTSEKMFLVYSSGSFNAQTIVFQYTADAEL